MPDPTWTLIEGTGPLVALAIHNGHIVRNELKDLFALSEGNRLREEDPFTEEWTNVAETRLIVHRSRFEVDLNRPREKAVYLRPEDAWGLQVWKQSLSPAHIQASLDFYDAFYAELRQVLQRNADKHGKFVVLDLHSYNHRREGPEAPPAPEKENPEVNLGTGTIDREYWAPVIERFMANLQQSVFEGRYLDVRENVKFRGGYLSLWIQDHFPRTGCALAVEFKKFFMDEWSGQPDFQIINMGLPNPCLPQYREFSNRSERMKGI